MNPEGTAPQPCASQEEEEVKVVLEEEVCNTLAEYEVRAMHPCTAELRT